MNLRLSCRYPYNLSNQQSQREPARTTAYKYIPYISWWPVQVSRFHFCAQAFVAEGKLRDHCIHHYINHCNGGDIQTFGSDLYFQQYIHLIYNTYLRPVLRRGQHLYVSEVPHLWSSHGRDCTFLLKHFWAVELLTWGTPCMGISLV